MSNSLPSAKNIVIIAIGLAVIMMLTTAFAQQGASADVDGKIASQIRPEWRACDESRDCDRLDYDCSGIIAFNKAYKKEVAGVVYSIARAGWNMCDVTHEKDIPTCQNNRCKILQQ